MAAQGAELIDVGAMSTAPYKQGWIPASEEQQRLVAALPEVVAEIRRDAGL